MIMNDTELVSHSHVALISQYWADFHQIKDGQPICY